MTRFIGLTGLIFDVITKNKNYVSCISNLYKRLPAVCVSL